MNIPIPQDIPGMITFWIFLSWIPLLRIMALNILAKVHDDLDNYEPDDDDISETANYYISMGSAVFIILVFWAIITAALLGLRLLIQMIWC